MTLAKTQRKGSANVIAHLLKLETAAKECTITFRVWEERNPMANLLESTTGSPCSKKLLERLSGKFTHLLKEDVQAKMAQIWMVFLSLYKEISSWTPPPKETVEKKAKDWICLFLSLKHRCDGFQEKNITPYMHTLVYHVPYFIKKYGNIKMFSGQGVEKNNDDAKRHYFSSNLHDTVGEVLKAEGRLDETSKFKRTKRKYTRKTTGANKQPRLDQDS